MNDIKIGPEVLDPSDYWQAVGRIVELKSIPREQVTDEHRDAYAAQIALVDEHSQMIRDGRSTGWSTLDELMWSGQIMSRERFEELSAMEERLVVNEPVLFQDGNSWRVGIVAHDKLYFSRVHRNSVFAPAANGHPAIVVRSYVEVTIPQWISHPDADKQIDIHSIAPDYVPPEAGGGIGLPLTTLFRNRFDGHYPIPESMYESWQTYQEAYGYPPNQYGFRLYRGALHVGREAVEANLGVSLEELMAYEENDHILDYVTRP